MATVIVQVTRQYRGYYENGLLSKGEYLRFLGQLHAKTMQRNLINHDAMQRLPQVIDGIHAMMQQSELSPQASIGEHIDRHARLQVMATNIRLVGGKVKGDF